MIEIRENAGFFQHDFIRCNRAVPMGQGLAGLSHSPQCAGKYCSFKFPRYLGGLPVSRRPVCAVGLEGTRVSLCHRCHQHENRNAKPRPKDLCEKWEFREDTISYNSDKCAGCLVGVQARKVGQNRPEKNTRTWCPVVQEVLCNECVRYLQYSHRLPWVDAHLKGHVVTCEKCGSAESRRSSASGKGWSLVDVGGRVSMFCLACAKNIRRVMKAGKIKAFEYLHQIN